MNENELDIKIEVAKQQGLFNEENIDNNKVFDCYGNYFFPTDFSNDEANTILPYRQYEQCQWFSEDKMKDGQVLRFNEKFVDNEPSGEPPREFPKSFQKIVDKSKTL